MKLIALIVFLTLMMAGGIYAVSRANREPAVDELRFVRKHPARAPASSFPPIIIPSALPPRSPYQPLGAGGPPDTQEWPGN